MTLKRRIKHIDSDKRALSVGENIVQKLGNLRDSDSMYAKSLHKYLWSIFALMAGAFDDHEARLKRLEDSHRIFRDARVTLLKEKAAKLEESYKDTMGDIEVGTPEALIMDIVEAIKDL